MSTLSVKILPQDIKRWSRIFTTGCFLIAVLALSGWLFDIDVLKSPISGLAAMNPTTALCLLLLSLSLFVLHGTSKALCFVAYSLSGICLLIGINRILEVPLWMNLQVDQLLFMNDLSEESINKMPSRMTQDGALSFVLGSIAVFSARSRRLEKNIPQWLSVAIASISWVTILAYLYRVPEFYGELPYSPMAIHTAIALLFLSLALLTFDPENGLAKDVFGPHQGSAAGWYMFPVVFIMPVVLGYLRLWGHWNQLFSTEFGVALLVVSITVVVSIVVFISIQMLNKRDAQQKYQANDLEQLNKDLKEKNDEIHALNEELVASNEEMVSTNEELTIMNEQLQSAYEKIREQSETILRQKDEQLNRVLDSSLDVIWSIDLTGKGEHYISRSAEKVFGTKITEAMLADADYWTARTHEDDRHIRKEAFEKLFQTGTSESTYRINNSSNEYRWIHHRSKLVYDGNGKPSRYEGIITDITAHKNQEDILNQYRENIDVIFSNTVEEILLLDHEGKVVLFNKALDNFLTMATGSKPQIGKYVWETTSAQRRDASKKLFERAIKGETITVDAPLETFQGRVVHELRYEPVFVDGKVKYVTVISVDVTEKKKRENLLRQSEANLRAIFDHTEDAFMLLDSEYNIIMFNAASRNIAASNFKAGDNIFDVMDEGRKEIFREFLKRVLNGETVKYDIKYGERQNLIWYHITISAVRSNDDLVGYCITTNNYTPIKLAEITLAESEERFRTLIENSEDIFVLTNPEGKLMYVNTGVEKITGYSYKELLDMPDSTLLIHPDDLGNYQKFFEEAAKNPGKNINTNFRTKHKQGHWQWMEGTAVNLTDHASIQGIVMNFRDITQRKKSEEEKTSLVAQLIEQNNDLRQFSFIASHNLRGPVASLLGLFNLFRENELTPDSLELLTMSKKSINHLDTVIRDLSSILEMRSHQLRPKERVQIKDTVNIVKVTIQDQIDSCHAEIILDDKAVDSFHTIKSYFYSIVYNLVSNAVKYRSHNRRPEIRITTFKTNSSVGFIVKDNGIGIDLHQSKERMFGLYQRFHLEAEGKGIGLYMVKTQVQLLNGKIEVESTLDIGTTFTVSFPSLNQ